MAQMSSVCDFSSSLLSGRGFWSWFSELSLYDDCIWWQWRM